MTEVGWYWSWLLTITGVTGLYVAGSKRKIGWAIGISAQVLWFVYAIISDQYGFILSVFAYGGVYVRNWVRWRREEHEASMRFDQTAT